jgi:hypothetical protein
MSGGTMSVHEDGSGNCTGPQCWGRFLRAEMLKDKTPPGVENDRQAANPAPRGN